MTRASISAFIVCCNEEDQIRRCLESVKWCDEIIIVDSGSTDNTRAICGEYTDRTLHKAWPGFVEQKCFALEQCTKEWVINIDADEEVSPELRDEILQILNSPQSATDINGYSISRVVFHLNRWWRKGGWYPEYRLRFSRRESTTWGGHDPHEKAIVTGKTSRLKGELRHYTYANLFDQVTSMNKLSTSAAQTLFKQGGRTSLFNILIRPWIRMFKFFVLKRGYREGRAGIIVSVLEGLYVFLKYAKLWEMQMLKPPNKSA